MATRLVLLVWRILIESTECMCLLITCPTRHSNLIRHSVVDCDPDDNVGCASGLVCGEDNCGQFHDTSDVTGFNDASDCCEGKCY